MPIGCLRRRCATWAAGPRTRCADAPNYSARLAVPRPGVLPFLGQRAVHALDLAVLPGAVGPRVDMAGALGFEQRVELSAAVARAVVGHHALDPHAHAPEEAQAPAHERRAGALALVGQQLGVGDPAEVVDGDVQAGRAPRRGGRRRRACGPLS